MREGNEPLRLHLHSQLDQGGVPEWAPKFARRMAAIKGADWWDFDPIVRVLLHEGYRDDLDLVRLFHGRPPATASTVCHIHKLTPKTCKKRYERVWNAAYDQFHEQYPGVIHKRWHNEMWISVLFGVEDESEC